jgi:hypothetical protein
MADSVSQVKYLSRQLIKVEDNGGQKIFTYVHHPALWLFFVLVHKAAG